MRIGVAGLNASGKTECVRALEARGFYPMSLSDVIREDLDREGTEPTRERMIEKGRALRERFGPGILAERVLGRLPADRNHVVDSIRHPAEVEALKGAGEFLLIWVETEARTRYERLRARGRVGEEISFEEFEAVQKRELRSADESGQQLLAVRELADEVIENNAGLDALHAQLQRILERHMFFRARPSWDEYFMNIAHVVGTRSNCIKRKVGCVIVSDRRIISTGYNGTPRGVRNCNEGGCPRCAGGAAPGTRLDECLCNHAEENAITQAAYHGVTVQGAGLYTTLSPCLICTKMIINAGIHEIVFDARFPLGERSLALLAEAGVKVRCLEDGEETTE
jgi:dCMP deaminase